LELCNESGKHMDLPKHVLLGYTEAIHKICGGVDKEDGTCGQVFDGEGWNLVMRRCEKDNKGRG
jgi:hypothetical protein